MRGSVLKARFFLMVMLSAGITLASHAMPLSQSTALATIERQFHLALQEKSLPANVRTLLGFQKTIIKRELNELYAQMAEQGEGATPNDIAQFYQEETRLLEKLTAEKIRLLVIYEETPPKEEDTSLVEIHELADRLAVTNSALIEQAGKDASEAGDAELNRLSSELQAIIEKAYIRSQRVTPKVIYTDKDMKESRRSTFAGFAFYCAIALSAFILPEDPHGRWAMLGLFGGIVPAVVVGKTIGRVTEAIARRIASNRLRQAFVDRLQIYGIGLSRTDQSPFMELLERTDAMTTQDRRQRLLTP